MSHHRPVSLTDRIQSQLERTRRSYPSVGYAWAFVSRTVDRGERRCIGIHTVRGERMPLTLELLRRVDEGHLDHDGALVGTGLTLLGGVHPVILYPLVDPGRRTPESEEVATGVGFCLGVRSPLEESRDRVTFYGRVAVEDLDEPLLVCSANRPPGWPR